MIIVYLTLIKLMVIETLHASNVYVLEGGLSSKEDQRKIGIEK